MKITLFLYTTDGCSACKTMKAALERLGAKFIEIRLTNGMTVPPDVRSFPTLAMEKNGKRSTLCKGWTGSIEQLKKKLEESLGSFFTMQSH